MRPVPPLLSFLLMVLSGWVHRHQLIVIEFLQAENRLLKKLLHGKRLRFTDAERALLARKAKAVGRKALLDLDTIVSPDTLMQWHRLLVAQKCNFIHRRKKYLIVDRDAKYSEQFRRLIRDNGTKVIRLRPMSPNLNAYAERFVHSIKDECLDRMIFMGQASLHRAVTEYMAHYHGERNHQGLNNRLIRRTPTIAANNGMVHRSVRLGGMLSFDYREAA